LRWSETAIVATAEAAGKGHVPLVVLGLSVMRQRRMSVLSMSVRIAMHFVTRRGVVPGLIAVMMVKAMIGVVPSLSMRVMMLPLLRLVTTWLSGPLSILLAVRPNAS